MSDINDNINSFESSTSAIDIDLNPVNDGSQLRIIFQTFESILLKVIEYKFGKMSFTFMEHKKRTLFAFGIVLLSLSKVNEAMRDARLGNLLQRKSNCFFFLAMQLKLSEKRE
jgi:hypothetical protein